MRETSEANFKCLFMYFAFYLFVYLNFFFGGWKEQDNRAKKEERAVENIKSNLLISGAVIVIMGALFAISKKLRES